MCNNIPGNQKHLSLDDRIIIEKSLDQHRSFRSIAASLDKDPTTISKEIKKHCSFHEHNHFNEPTNISSPALTIAPNWTMPLLYATAATEKPAAA